MTEITINDLKEYLREDVDTGTLETVLSAAKSYIRSYTGLTTEECDEHEDLSVACLALAADYYDNRTATMQNIMSENPLISNILHMHSVNLIGGA